MHPTLTRLFPADRLRPTVVTAALVVVLFVAARWSLVGHFELSRFILIGRNNVDLAQAPHGVHLMHGYGYDGQFYYRFALDPGKLDGRVHGILLDNGLRRQRIGYPTIVWLLSYGQVRVAAYAMVVVNMVAVVAMAYLGAFTARLRGLNPAWGLVLVGYAGLVFSLDRDLTEVTGSAFLLAGLVAIGRQRWLLGALALSAGVLTRETVMIVPVAYGFTRLVSWLPIRKGWSRPGLADLPWLLPGLAYAGWQLAVEQRYGSFPLTDEQSNGTTPGSALLHGMLDWAEHPSISRTFSLVQVIVLMVLVVVVARSSKGVEAYVLGAFAVAVLLAASLSSDVWNGDLSELRVLVEIHLLGVYALLGRGGQHRLRLYTQLAGTLTVVAMAISVRSI